MIKVNNVNDVNILLQILTIKPLGLRWRGLPKKTPKGA